MEVIERSKIRGENMKVNGHHCKCEGCGEGGKDVYSMLNMVTKLLGGNGGITKVDGGGRDDDVDDEVGLDGFYVDDDSDDGEAQGLRRSSNSSASYGSSNDSDGEFDYLLDEVEIESPMEAQVKKLLASEHDAISNLHRFGYDGSPIQFSSTSQVAKFLPPTLSSNRVLTELQPLSELLPDNHTVIHVYDRTEVADAVVDYALIGVSKYFRGTRFVRIDGDVLTGSTGASNQGDSEGTEGSVNLSSWLNSNTTTQARGILVLKGTQVIKFEPNATVYTSGSEPGNVAGKLEMIIGELHTESIYTDVHADDVFKEVKEEVLGLEYGVRKWLSNVGVPPSEDGVHEYVKKACAEMNKNPTAVRKTKEEDGDDDGQVYCDVEGCGKMFQHTHVGTGAGEGMVDLGGV